ncbi:MAG TPA: CRTAC1 family protein, partial [Gemmataceae bacterium]|nr:CRTAC1 family protein [Gemmataceae bacterium]
RWRGTGFGTALADLDNDGALDLPIVNGAVGRPREGRPEPAPGQFWADYAQRNQLFVNDGTGHFRDVSERETALCGEPMVGRALAVGDVDNDGALDLLVTQVGGPALLLHNVAPKRGNWLMVRAVDPKLRRDAYGAEVRARAGGREWVRWVNPGYSYLASGDPRVHFGLGAAERVERLRVTWPDGSAEDFPGGAVNTLRELRRGEGTPAAKGGEAP